MKRALFALLLVSGCSKNTAFSAENRAPTASAPSATASSAPAPIVAAAAVRPDCAAPSKLAPLGTLHERAWFFGDVLVTSASGHFDPETLARVPAPPVSTKIESHAGASITPSRYRDVVNGRGITSGNGDGETVLVEDLASGRRIFATDACPIGRSFDGWLSSTGRFLLCRSDRGGTQVWDLDSRDPAVGGGWWVGDAIFAATDAYAVARPTTSWSGDDDPLPGITWFDFDTHTSKVVLAATLAKDAADDTFDVQICGDGDLFAATGDDELAVFSGKSGAKLASIPSKKGGALSFSMTGKYLAHYRDGATKVFRLEL